MFASYIYTIARVPLCAGSHAVRRIYKAIHPSEPWVRSALPPVTALAATPDTTERCGPSREVADLRFRVICRRGRSPTPADDPRRQIEAIIRDSLPKLANREA